MSYSEIAEGSEATPGLWNSRFSDLWASVGTLTNAGYSAITAVRSTDRWTLESGLSVSGVSINALSIGTGTAAIDNFLIAKSISANLMQVTIPPDGTWLFQGAGSMSLDYAGTMSMTSGIVVGSYPVLGTRKTGWSAVPTGNPIRTTFDSSTATLGDVAQRLAALIIDLTAHGLIGP